MDKYTKYIGLNYKNVKFITINKGHHTNKKGLRNVEGCIV